jgi:ERCC4-type nuclease
MRVVVDTREHAFIETIRTKVVQYPFIDLQIAQLAIGDMEIYGPDDELLFVWERKTFQDLLSSIKDGRYKEQSFRLLHTYGASKVIYLIEGIISQLSPSEKKLAIATMSSLSLKKNFHLWRSVHVQDSVDSFLTICEKLNNDDSNNNSNNNTKGPVEVHAQYAENMVKKVKKENITRDNIGEIFLCQIPDISSTSAKVLMNHVNGDFKLLCSIIRERPLELSELRVGGEKPRKMSKKVFERLAEFLG